jgi:chemotaxis signal transduction protein
MSEHPSSPPPHADAASALVGDERRGIERMRALLDRPLSAEELAANTRAVAVRAEARGGRTRSVLAFTVGAERLALEAEDAARVVPLSPVRRVPHRTNAVFAGLANIGGELTLIARAGEALGVAAGASQTHFIVIGRPGERWAFAVDSVEGVRRVEESRTLPPPATIRHAADGCTQYLAPIPSANGVGGVDAPLVSVLDAARLAALFARSLA